jgi:hypothetical protein
MRDPAAGRRLKLLSGEVFAHLASGRCPNLNDFSVAQAFTPGDEKAIVFKSPINGALISALSHPGVNAWARENVQPGQGFD